MIQFEKSDDEDNKNGNLVYKDPKVLEPELPPEDKLFHDWTQRNQEELHRKAIEKCRKVGAQLLFDSDGLEKLDEDSDREAAKPPQTEK